MENTPEQQRALDKHIEWYNNLNETEKKEYDLIHEIDYLQDLQKEHLKVIRGLIYNLDNTDNAECKAILNKLKESGLWEPYVKPFL